MIFTHAESKRCESMEVERMAPEAGETTGMKAVRKGTSIDTQVSGGSI